MEVFNLFTLGDFLAFFFPGLLDILGFYLILLATPLHKLVNFTNISTGAVILILVFSYLAGVLISTITELWLRDELSKKIKGKIQIENPKLRNEIITAFETLILDQEIKNGAANEEYVEAKTGGRGPQTGSNGEQTGEEERWNKSYYYVCRALVMEQMPVSKLTISREGAYRQLRLNLIPSTLITGIAGLIWGLIIVNNKINFISYCDCLPCKIKDHLLLGCLIVFISIVITALIVINLYKMMIQHEEREVRETLSSFLWGYKMGKFTKSEVKPEEHTHPS